jgi:hypothetical protein
LYLAISETISLWNFKEIGDKMQYTLPNGSIVTNSSLLIHNLNWPGAMTIYKQGEFFNIYIGYGIRSNGNSYYPMTPNLIEQDPEGLTEYKEPNPDKEPEVIEPDSDEDNKADKDVDDN